MSTSQTRKRSPREVSDLLKAAGEQPELAGGRGAAEPGPQHCPFLLCSGGVVTSPLATE